MKKTVFNQLHRDAGGKMVDFAGFEMPVEFKGIKEEHLAVRNGVGVFDVSHMGEIWVRGPKAADLVQYVTSNDITLLSPGQAQYSCFPNGNGGIVDDLLVYLVAPEEYLLVVNASNIEKDWNWLNEQNVSAERAQVQPGLGFAGREKHLSKTKHLSETKRLTQVNRFGAELENASGRTAQLAVQGPKATAVLQKLTPVNLDEISYYTFVCGTFAGIDGVIISATGYTGAGGFELYFDNRDALSIYEAIFEAGAPEGIQPIGLGARDTLRLEMGYCLYGNDIDDTTSPIEAGLGWITKFNDRNNFIDKDRLWAQKTEGVSRILKGFEMIDRGIPRHDYELTDSLGNIIGRVTSGTQSPVLNKGIGMGYLDKAYAACGTEIYVKVRNKLLKAKVVKTPFIR